jgi:two-component system OmpR family sensor kinase
VIVKRNSVFFTVLFAFIVTVGSVSYTFLQLYESNRIKHIETLFSKYSLISQIYHTFLLKQISQPIYEANLAMYDLYPVDGSVSYGDITQRASVLKEMGESIEENGYALSLEAPFSELVTPAEYVKLLSYEGKIYFWIQSPRHCILLEDRKAKPYTPIILFYAYVTILGFLVLSFGLIIYRIAPLRRLRRQIARFGEGDMGVSFHVDGEDEIAMISNELETAQNKIRSLIESRTLFLRNIMHELKTPIAKGRIAATMLESQKQQTRFEGIFERLEGLIGEFALIEEISSGSQYMKRSEYRLVDIIDGAIDMAMVEYEAVDNAIMASVKVEVDYRLFTTAVKNMIDNAIKYSPTGTMKIRLEKENILFINEGRALNQPLSYYIEPFTKEHPTKDSFGLGLYIVDAIVREHGYILRYERKEQSNYFYFEKQKGYR